MKDYPVALHSWGNNKSVHAWHWVTLTAADISVFDFPSSTVDFSSWGEMYYGATAYKWSDAWNPGVYLNSREKPDVLSKASIVFFEV